MSVELILLTIVALSQVAGFTVLGIMLYRMWEQTGAFTAATFLQGRRMEEILKESAKSWPAAPEVLPPKS